MLITMIQRHHTNNLSPRIALVFWKIKDDKTADVNVKE
jgi:hypothetical protein